MGDFITFGPDDFVATHNFQQKVQVDQHNRELIAKYRRAVDNWNLSIDQKGVPPPNTAVPSVPNGWTLSAPDSEGLVNQIDGGPVLPAPLPLHGVLTESGSDPVRPMIGGRIWANAPYFSALPMDAFRGGKTPPNTQAADGTVGTFEKTVSAIGFDANNLVLGAPVRGFYTLLS